jgi:hypothetical protein
MTGTAHSGNRFGRHGQELVRAEGTTRITARSNETEADPLLGGSFTGDYIEVA